MKYLAFLLGLALWELGVRLWRSFRKHQPTIFDHTVIPPAHPNCRCTLTPLDPSSVDPGRAPLPNPDEIRRRRKLGETLGLENVSIDELIRLSQGDR